MLVRFAMGVFKGLLIGGALAAFWVYAMGAGTLGPIGAYLTAAGVGVLTGLIAGRPIWARDAKLEAGLKAGVGLVVALVGMFVTRKWLAFQLDLSVMGGATGALGDQPLAILPLLGAGLGILFEVDDAVGSSAGGSPRRVAGTQTRVEPADDTEIAAGLEEEPSSVPPAQRG